jgi:hypothetical protein
MRAISVPTVVAKVFENDVYLWNNRLKLYHTLGFNVPLVSMMDLLAPFEYYVTVLGAWVGRNGNDATTDKLAEIFEECGFRMARGLH